MPLTTLKTAFEVVPIIPFILLKDKILFCQISSPDILIEGKNNELNSEIVLKTKCAWQIQTDILDYLVIPQGEGARIVSMHFHPKLHLLSKTGVLGCNISTERARTTVTHQLLDRDSSYNMFYHILITLSPIHPPDSHNANEHASRKSSNWAKDIDQ